MLPGAPGSPDRPDPTDPADATDPAAAWGPAGGIRSGSAGAGGCGPAPQHPAAGAVWRPPRDGTPEQAPVQAVVDGEVTIVFEERAAGHLRRLAIAAALLLLGLLGIAVALVEGLVVLGIAAGPAALSGAVGSAVYLRAMRRPRVLVVDAAGLHFRGGLTLPPLPFSLVERFVVLRPRGERLVGYHFNEDGLIAAVGAHRDPALRRLGAHGVLPSLQAFGQDPTALVATLNGVLGAARGRPPRR